MDGATKFHIDLGCFLTFGLGPLPRELCKELNMKLHPVYENSFSKVSRLQPHKLNITHLLTHEKYVYVIQSQLEHELF